MIITPFLENLKILVEHFISLSGLSGVAIPIMRHALLVLVAVFLSWLSGWLCKTFIVPIIYRITTHTPSSWDNVLFNRAMLNTACKIVPAIVICLLLPLVFYEYAFLREVASRFTAVYIAVMTTKLLLVLLKNIETLDSERDSSVQQYTQSFIGVLRILILFIAGIIIVAILLNQNPLSLIAGLGATSAVLMLIFKDTIEGLVAGIRLNSNHMVHKGDWIVVPSTPANGIVEDITLTTVKIKNFDNTTVTVSPVALVNGSFQNWKTMKEGPGRRVNRLIYIDFRSVRFITEEQKTHLINQKLFTEAQLNGTHINIALYRTYIETYLATRNDVCKDTTIVVREIEATQCGLPLEVVFFIKNDEKVHYEHTLAEIMEWCYAATALFQLTIYQQYPEQ